MEKSKFVGIVLISLFLFSIFGIVIAQEEENTEKTNVTCSDSDGGKNYYERGVAAYEGIPSARREGCIDNNTLREFYCENNTIKEENYTCENGCKDGACIESEPKCIDSDGGKDYYEKGETKETGECTSEEPCKGFEDRCIDNKTLEEGYCGENVLTEEYNCEGVCEDGRCIEESRTKQNKSGKLFYFYSSDCKHCKEIESELKELTKDFGEHINILYKNTGEYINLAEKYDIESVTSLVFIDSEGCWDKKTGYLESEEIEKWVLDSECGTSKPTLSGYRYSYWKCYGGEEQEQESESCLPSKKWKELAKEFCKEKCNQDGSKCRVNSFSLSKECEIEEKAYEEKYGEAEEESKKEKFSVCENACSLEGKCYPFGYRIDKRYCSDKGVFTSQLSEGKSCENDFECKSNICVNDKCVSRSLMKKIIEWFKSIFGDS